MVPLSRPRELSVKNPIWSETSMAADWTVRLRRGEIALKFCAPLGAPPTRRPGATAFLTETLTSAAQGRWAGRIRSDRLRIRRGWKAYMSHLTYLEAGVVGLIQGVTELFPVSSLGHNVLIPALIGGAGPAT